MGNERQQWRKVKRNAKRLAKARLQSTQYAKGIAGALPKKQPKRPRRSRAAKRRAAYMAYLKSDEWKLFRFRILSERGMKCQKCGRDSGIMDIHHLHYLTFKHERPEDVEVWCRACHMRHHGR